MKKIISILLCLFLCACSSGFDVSKFKDELLNSGIYQSEIVELNQDEIKAIYMHPLIDEVIDSMSVYISNSTEIEELCIVKDHKVSKEIIENRLKEFKSEVERYFPEQASKVNNYILEEKDGYIIFIICDDYDLAMKIINKY